MALNAGDIVFLGFDADNNDVVFITTTTVKAGEVIYFTDTEWTGSEFNAGEQLIRWTVPSDIQTGTVITIDMIARSNPDGPDARFYVGSAPGSPTDEVAGVEYLRGGGGLARSNEQFWALQGDYDETTREFTPTSTGDTNGFVSVISNEEEGITGGPILTNTGLNAENGAVTVPGDEDFMIFDQVASLGDKIFVERPEVLRAEFLKLVGDADNWVTADGRGTQNTTAGFDFNVGQQSGLAIPVNEDETTQLYFTGDRVAFFDAIDENETGFTTVQPVFAFDRTDLVEVSVVTSDIYTSSDTDPDNSDVSLEGEFNYDQVVITKITVMRADGSQFDLDIDGAINVKTTGGAKSGAKEQGDSFFTTDDDVNIPGASVQGSAKMVFSLDETFLNADSTLKNATTIERSRTDLDTNGDGLLDMDPGFANENFNISRTTLQPFPCFLAGTLIDTPSGPVPIETLVPGDSVCTLDRGDRVLRWIGKVSVPAIGENAPVLIRKGALGNSDDLRVSPQHRILMDDWRLELFFGLGQSLVAAKHLCDGTAIIREPSTKLVTYVHILFDRHELVCTSGLWSESYFPGSYGLSYGAGPVERELTRLFTGNVSENGSCDLVRPCLRRYEARVLG